MTARAYAAELARDFALALPVWIAWFALLAWAAR